TVGSINIGAAVPIGGAGIVFNGGTNPGDMVSIKMSGGASAGTLRLNGKTTLNSNLVVDLGSSTANGFQLTDSSPLDSRAAGPRSLSIVAGSGGITVDSRVGFASAMSTINLDTSGLISIGSNAALRTVKSVSDNGSNLTIFSAVSNIPLINSL